MTEDFPAPNNDAPEIAEDAVTPSSEVNNEQATPSFIPDDGVEWPALPDDIPR